MNEPYKFQGSLDDAIMFLQKAKSGGVFTEPQDAYLNLAQVYLMKEMFLQAITELKEAQRLYPGDEQVQQLLESTEVSLH